MSPISIDLLKIFYHIKALNNTENTKAVIFV
jgi:hypothetical protein